MCEAKAVQYDGVSDCGCVRNEGEVNSDSGCRNKWQPSIWHLTILPSAESCQGYEARGFQWVRLRGIEAAELCSFGTRPTSTVCAQLLSTDLLISTFPLRTSSLVLPFPTHHDRFLFVIFSFHDYFILYTTDFATCTAVLAQ